MIPTTNKQGQKQRPTQPALPAFDLSMGKIPPQARELEEAILGAIMIEKGAFDIAAELLKPESFYVDAHQKIFRAFFSLNSGGSNIDLLTVVDELQKNDQLDLVGGMFALMTLTKNVVSSAHIEDHCKIVQERFINRELIRMGGELITLGYNDQTDAFELLDHAEKSLFDLSTGNIKSGFYSAEDLSAETINLIEHRMNNRQDLTGVPTGYRALDAITCGWQPTDLIILAARPSVGKTAFALNLARNAASHPTKPVPVGLFSLEMSRSQLMSRLTSAESKVSMEFINSGRLTTDQFNTIHEAVGNRLSKYPIFIDDSAYLNLRELRAKARRMVSKHKVGMIIIDYLQLMSGDEGKGNREQEISKISRGCKALAKELNVPVIALSQMSRDVEKRADKTPMLADLRESGAIEQDADLVGFLYRPDYQQDPDKIDPAIKNDAFLKIAKHRNGALETLAFYTDLSIQTWFDFNGWQDHTQPQYAPSNFRPIRQPAAPVKSFYEPATHDDIEEIESKPF